jgi:ribonuclease HI
MLIKYTTGKQMFKIFTDGSCPQNPGIGGWAVIIESDNGVNEYSGSMAKATNNTAEITAALEGLKRVPEGSEVELTCDSNYVIKGMTEWITNWKRNKWLMKSEDGAKWVPRPNKDLWQKLESEASKRKVTWKWVRGHDNHPQNERCDYLAGEAVRMFKETNF